MSYFQTLLAQSAAAYLSSELDTEVRIDKVDIVFFDLVDIQGVYVEDKIKDTLLYAQEMRINIADFSLSQSFVDLDEVRLTNATVRMVKYANDSTFNFQHLVDYFASTEEDTTTSSFEINVRKLKLEDINFKYQDENAEKTTFGLDYSNLAIRHLSGEFSEFSMEGDEIRVQLEDLHFQEQSGFALSKLSAGILYSSTLIQLDQLTLAYNNSILISDQFQLRTPNGSEDFSDFVNQVYFKGNIRNSVIDMGDIAYFSPSIYGMDAKIKLNNVLLTGPIYGMRLDSLDLSMLTSTVLRGNFQIPNFDLPDEALFQEEIVLLQTTVIDIQRLKLTPFLGGEDYLVLPESMTEAGNIQLVNGHFTGYLTDFQVDGYLTSGIGNVSSEYGLRFFMDKAGVLNYQSGLETGLGKDLIVENLNLGALTGNDLLGLTTGYVSIGKGSKGTSLEQMDLKFVGSFEQIELDGYAYQGINIRKGEFKNEIFTGIIDIEDDNLALNYDGSVDLKGKMKFDFVVRIDNASLTELDYKKAEFVDRLQSKIEVHIEGTSLDELTGTLSIRDLDYKEGPLDFKMEKMDLSISRSETSDSVNLYSDYIDFNLSGKFDLQNVWPVVQNQLARVMNNLIDETDASASKNEYYDLRVNLKNINPLLQFVDPNIYVAEESRIRSSYSRATKKLTFEFKSDLVTYEEMKFTDILLNNQFDSLRASVQYEIGLVQLSDSLGVKNAALFSYIKDNHFSTNIGWDRYGDVEPALFAFTTEIDSLQKVSTEFNPSFFFLQSEKWSISPKSKFVWTPDFMQFSEFDITNKNHLVNVEGKLSKDPKDWLYFQVRDFDLADLNGILDGALTIGGVLNIDGGVSDVYKNIRFMSLSDIKGLVIDGELVGDLLVDNKWNKATNSVQIFGNLKRDKKETFKFDGHYYPDLKKENLAVDLIFDNTDIGFLNAFSDPELYTDIEGILNGKLKITGELVSPAINGSLELLSTKVKVPMLNVGFGLAGVLNFTPNKITADKLKVFDQEGNKALCTMNLKHKDWGDWNYIIGLDMLGVGTDKRFLAMNTFYRDGDFYYGKAYVNGDVSIKGTPDLTEMSINATTLKGTDLKLAMYGAGDLEESSFIVFDTILPSKREENGEVINQLESSGLVMKMKFNISKETKATIVFDPIYEDQIVVDQGEGSIELNMDEYGEMEMRGKYTIYEGAYFMRVKGLVSKDFEIRNGSNLAWTGSPYDALIEIYADYLTEVSLEPILPPGIEDRSGDKEEVIATLKMSNTLMEPIISFKISAPRADDVGQTALRSIEADQDELNKQFIALLAFGKFLSTNGGAGGSGNAAIDFAEGQINEILGSVSSKYAIAADLSSTSGEIGFSRQVGEKITITTSLGVMSGTETSAGGIIGDVVVEYRLNDDGSSTVNIFNSSNQGSDAEKGPFTQGVSYHYSEVFDNAKEFKLLQGFLNIFRSKANDVDYKKDKSNGKKKPVEGAKEKIIEGS